MVNTNELLALIANSGKKKQYFADELGMHIATFWRKVRNVSEFKPSEIDKLCNLLGVNSLKEKQRLFFYNAS